MKKALSNMFGNNNGYLSEMINTIYENDKIRFNQLATEIKNIIEERKQRMNANNTPDSNGYASDDILSLATKEETIEIRTK